MTAEATRAGERHSAAGGGADLSTGMRWSGISVAGREFSRIVFTVLLARLVGPEAFGTVAQALVYIGVIGLLLDQGFSSALIQRPKVDPALPGAIVSVNLGVGAGLMLLTIAIAPLWASFMSTPELTLVLIALAPSLLVRAASITPRAVLLRAMDFRSIGIADVASAFVGGLLGAVAAFAGAGYWALVVQIVSTDVLLVAGLLLVGAGRRPNLRMVLVREIAGFSWRAFAAGVLINSVARNVDKLLIGRFQGAEPLAFYGLAYRLLLLPVQLVGQTIGAVLFPAFARLADDLAALRTEMVRTTRAMAMLALPSMALVAAAAPQLVPGLFGHAWNPAIPVVQVLAMAGAVQAVYVPSTTPLVLGLGHARLNLRFAWLTTVVSLAGIVAGLPFGVLGVAIGYSVATASLVPVEWAIRWRLLGMPLGAQALMLLPGFHVALWVAATYFLVVLALPGQAGFALALGIPLACVAGLAVLRVAHRERMAELAGMLRGVLGRNGPGRSDRPTDERESGSGTGG